MADRLDMILDGLSILMRTQWVPRDQVAADSHYVQITGDMVRWQQDLNSLRAGQGEPHHDEDPKG
jgi:hypothetical protein